MQDSEEDQEKIIPCRPALGRRGSCQYYSPALVLSTNDEKRLQVVLELLQTEEKYNCCLHTLKSVFEDKLYSTNIIPVKDIEAIFPACLKEIREVHDQLCTAMRMRVEKWSYRSKVGDMFVHFFSSKNKRNLLGHYSSYSNNFPKSIRTISRCVRNSVEFETLLQNSSNGPSWKGLDLHALLLNPIQRLPRYLLLLKQLIRFTDVNHPDRVHVERALATMSQTVTVLNNSIESSLKVASEYTTRKRFTRRRSSIPQREALRVVIKTTDQLNLKPNTEEANAPAGQSRPVSICSSVSSGYASGEEGDNTNVNSTPTAPTCPCKGPNCNTIATQIEFSRLVKEMRHESALEKLSQQKFDFSVSCISPTLQRLHDVKRQQASMILETETGDSNNDLTISNTNLEHCKGDENPPNLDNKDALISTEKTIDQTMDNFIEDFSTTISNIENLHLMKLLSPDAQQVIKPRSYSDELHLLADKASCGSERDWDTLPSQVDETPLSSQNSSNFQRFRRHRRSWAPHSTSSKQNASGLPSQSVLASSLHDVVVEDDTISVWSGISTISGESTVSGVSAMSMPVDGKHATKRRYFKLKDFFRQLRSKQRRSKALIREDTMPTIPQEDTKSISDSFKRPTPRMMISSV